MLKKIIYFQILISLLFAYPVLAADRGMELTITPPLIKNNVSPGQVWKSYVKLVNNNSQGIDAYVEVLDFKGGKNNGTVEFLPKVEKEEGGEVSTHLLSQWIVLDSDPIHIPAFGSKEIPFIIDVPDNAEPGGHYAAILTGTQPPEKRKTGSSIQVSTLLASLILLSVQGDIKEEGKIRDFSLAKTVYAQPDVDFKVRFQNTGNIHIQPQGGIKIYNMMGKESGNIFINHQTEYGNVLPGGTREWEFNWKGEGGILNMGRYQADLALAYGENGRETVNRSLYFWVLDFKVLGIVFGSLFLILLLLFLIIKFYIRRALKNVQKDLGLVNSKQIVRKKNVVSPVQKKNVYTKPKSKKIIDLKKRD